MVQTSAIEIRTRDGVCPARLLRPTTGGPWPGILLYMDGLGMRPAIVHIAERIAGSGYVVLVPDLFYRAGAYEAIEPSTFFGDAAARQAWIARYMSTANAANAMSDTAAFLDVLAAQPEVVQPKVGTTGYCMGGFLSLTAAGTYPERVAAAASFHGGRLATDAPDSPHRLASRINGRVYVAGAIEDPSFPDEMKARLETALSDAKVDHRIESYPARHGWCVGDTPVYDAAQAERHYTELLALFDAVLKRA